MIKSRTMGADIVSANYQREPIDIKGRLYTGFKTYNYLPIDNSGHLLFTEIRNYTKMRRMKAMIIFAA